MSVETTCWAMEQRPRTSEAKFVLVMMSDAADMNGYWRANLERLADATCQPIPVLRDNIDQLVNERLLKPVDHHPVLRERGTFYKLMGEFT